MKAEDWKGKFTFVKKKKFRAFTLIELLTAVGISAILLVLLLSLLGFSVNLMGFTGIRDESRYMGRSTLSYIEEEINRSYGVYPVGNKLRGKAENLGFVLQMKPYQETRGHHYVAYYMSGEKLVRVTRTSSKVFEELNEDINQGNNTLASGIQSIHGSYYDPSRKMIVLNILTRDNNEYHLELFVGDKNAN